MSDQPSALPSTSAPTARRPSWVYHPTHQPDPVPETARAATALAMALAMALAGLAAAPLNPFIVVRLVTLLVRGAALFWRSRRDAC